MNIPILHASAVSDFEFFLIDFRQRYPGLDDDELRKAARADMQVSIEDHVRISRVLVFLSSNSHACIFAVA